MTEEQKINRINICMECPNNQLVDVPMCVVCEKSVSVLTSDDEQTCPEDKW